MGLPVRDVSEVHCQRSVHRHQLKALLELLEILAQISSKKPQLGQELTPKAWGYRVTDATGNQSPPVIPAGVWPCFSRTSRTSCGGGGGMAVVCIKKGEQDRYCVGCLGWGPVGPHGE